MIELALLRLCFRYRMIGRHSMQVGRAMARAPGIDYKRGPTGAVALAHSASNPQ
jgi:hypothetical protein